MLDAFLEHPFFLNRHRQAPLLKERESFLNHLQQLRFILYICGEEMAAVPWAAEVAQRAPPAVCGSAQRLRPIHDRGARSLATFGALPHLEDIGVSGMVRGAASVVGESEEIGRA